MTCRPQRVVINDQDDSEGKTGYVQGDGPSYRDSDEDGLSVNGTERKSVTSVPHFPTVGVYQFECGTVPLFCLN